MESCWIDDGNCKYAEAFPPLPLPQCNILASPLATAPSHSSGVAKSIPPQNASSEKKQEVRELKIPRVHCPSPRRIRACNAKEVVLAPTWMHKIVIGRGGCNIRSITKDLPHIKVKLMREEGKIVINGPNNEVQLAKQVFEKFKNEILTTVAFEEVRVNENVHAHIVGRNGAKIKKIENETNTRIHFPNHARSSPGTAICTNVLHIEGDPKGVAAAKSWILDVAARIESHVTKEITIKHRFHTMLIGANGQNIKKLRDQFSGVVVSFPDAGEKCDKVTLRGPADEVEKCAEYLEEMARDAAAANHRQIVRVCKKFHADIVGQDGCNLRCICQETNTRVVMPTDTESDVVVIFGRQEDVEKARQRIDDIVTKLKYQVKIAIPRRLHKAIIGKKGKVIRSVVEECGGVRIQLPSSDSTSDEISIDGAKEDVEKAQSILMEITQRADQDVTEELHIDHRVHSRLIGRRGKSIGKLMDRFHVLVRFPTGGKKTDDTVMMIGKEENVKVAKKFILEVAEEFMQELAEREEDKDVCDLYSHSSSSPGSHGGRYRFQLKDFIVSDNVDKHRAPRQKHA